MYPPAKYTRISMLSMFLGKHPTGDNIIKNYKIHLNTNSGLIPFTYENTIFAKLEKLDYLPQYCLRLYFILRLFTRNKRLFFPNRPR